MRAEAHLAPPASIARDELIDIFTIGEDVADRPVGTGHREKHGVPSGGTSAELGVREVVVYLHANACVVGAIAMAPLEGGTGIGVRRIDVAVELRTGVDCQLAGVVGGLTAVVVDHATVGVHGRGGIRRPGVGRSRETAAGQGQNDRGENEEHELEGTRGHDRPLFLSWLSGFPIYQIPLFISQDFFEYPY